MHITGEERPGSQPRPSRPAELDVAALENDLRAQVRGEVRFDPGSRALYATDGSNYRQTPIGVVIPRDEDDVVATVAVCRRHGAPLLPRGGGTSLAGQCCNVAVVMDMSKYMNQVLGIDVGRQQARVQPGTILDDLRHAAEAHGLTFGPDPATHNHNTLGGMIGNNSCGIHSVMAAFAGTGPRTADNIDELDVLTYDGLRLRVGATSEAELEQIIQAGGRRGQIYRGLRTIRDRYADRIRERYPRIPRRVSGYNLDELLPERGFNVARALVGTEGTCVVVLEATARLIPNPAARSLLVLGYPDVYHAGDHIPEVMSHEPVGCEGIDDRLVSFMKTKGLRIENLSLLPSGNGWLMVEFGADSKGESDEKARRLMEALRRQGNAPSMKLFDNAEEEELLWKVRESGLGATAFVPGHPDSWPGWEDSAVPPDRVGEYLRKLRALFDKYEYECSLYGHLGQGCIHVRIDFGLTSEAGVKKYLAFIDEASDLVLALGGSCSGEHGDGQARGWLLPKMYGPELVQAFREFKALWDPDGRMNPGKVIDAYSPDQHLRLGPEYRPWKPDTYFKFIEDRGEFSRAALRCVSVGKCRRMEGGTMCPSFMVTREEMHSTRGRAHLLFEMMEQRTLKDGWNDAYVADALHLCLSCKGCKGDCPLNVDMATYKAEFLAHHYAHRLRPRSAYAFGLIFYWARLASHMPRLVNWITHTPGLRTVAKWVAGMAPEREIPPFADEPFTRWFRRRQAQTVPVPGRPQVLLWPDTFNNYFHPETAKAAVQVLEAAGHTVVIPDKWLCCGRPLYDYGMLKQAKKRLLHILKVLEPHIAAKTPMVGLEPSCVSVFRDEMVNLFPDDVRARRLQQQTYLLSEFLDEQGWEMPRLLRQAVVHGHCHHKAVLRMEAEQSLMKKLGLDVSEPDPGCCGMAGSFGFEKGDRYQVSMAVGERKLIPAVHDADKQALVVADGFSCREQIAQATDRQALHLAQVIKMAIDEGPAGPHGAYPERRYMDVPHRLSTADVLLAGGLATLALAGLAWALRRGRGRGWYEG